MVEEIWWMFDSKLINKQTCDVGRQIVFPPLGTKIKFHYETYYVKDKWIDIGYYETSSVIIIELTDKEPKRTPRNERKRRGGYSD